MQLGCQEEVKLSHMSEIGAVQSEPEFAVFIGIDWADQKHIWRLQVAGSKRRESGELEHSPEAVEAWVAHLCQRFAQRPIAVAVEQSRGRSSAHAQQVCALLSIPGTCANGRQHAASAIPLGC